MLSSFVLKIYSDVTSTLINLIHGLFMSSAARFERLAATHQSRFASDNDWKLQREVIFSILTDRSR